MRFALIDAKKAEIPIETAGVVLAHVRAAFATLNETYGSRRIHAELTAHGLAIGRHKVARLMRENSLKARQKARFRKTTDSDNGGPVTVYVLGQDSPPRRLIRNGVSTSRTCGRPRAGCTWRSSWICFRGGSSAGS